MLNLAVCVSQVIILDPTQENSAELLSVAEMFYANNIPLRSVKKSRQNSEIDSSCV